MRQSAAYDPVDVDVLAFALPDNLNFIIDLNAYGGVNSGYNIAAHAGTAICCTLITRSLI